MAVCPELHAFKQTYLREAKDFLEEMDVNILN
jgi:hypothetical protein